MAKKVRLQKGKGVQIPQPAKKKKKIKIGAAEIITGLVVIFIISGATVPNVSTWMGMRSLKDQAEKLYYDLERAKMHAVKYKEEVIVVFSPEAGKYSMHRDLNKNGKVDAGEQIEETILHPEVQFGTNHTLGVGNVWDTGLLHQNPIEIEDKSNRIVFGTQGQASSNAAIYLVRKKDVGETKEFMRAVKVTKTAGKVVVLKYYEEEVPPWIHVATRTEE